jgi:peptide/nickel transport system permease protein
MRVLRRRPALALGAVLVGGVVLTALLAPVLAGYDPAAQVSRQLLPPGEGYPLGTDELGGTS